MAETTQITEFKPKNTFVSVLVTQAVCVLLIIAAIFVIKFFFAAQYDKIINWYKNDVAVGVSAEDVLKYAEKDNEV